LTLEEAKLKYPVSCGDWIQWENAAKELEQKDKRIEQIRQEGVEWIKEVRLAKKIIKQKDKEIERLKKELSDLGTEYHYKTHELSEKYRNLKRKMQQALKEG
jgi:N-glycosylase/DNA lyase